MAKPNRCESYSLILANGQSLEMAASPRARPWLERLASIMGLERNARHGPMQIIFVRDGLEEIQEAIGLSPARISSEWRRQEVWPLLIHYGSEPLMVCELGNAPEGLELFRMMQATHYICSLLQTSGGLPLHAALLEHNGNGYVIAAPSGTGKSTCSRRIPSPWQALCDDFTLIVQNDKGRYCAHPFPTWSEESKKPNSGHSWNVQRHMPLKGIFLLKQSGEDGIKPLGKGEASAFIYHSVSQICQLFWKGLSDEDCIASRKTLFDNSCRLADSVPAFILKASLTGKFWEQMEQGLQEAGATVEEIS